LRKKTHYKNITESISTTIVATMSPITTAIATITIVHRAHTQTTNHTHKKKTKKNQLRSNVKTKKTMSLTKTKKVMAEYTTYLVCFCLLKLNQGT
jgi:predicted ATPase